MKIKPKIFKSKFADIKVEVMASGWICIQVNNGDNISIGVPPNVRTKLILDAIKYVEEKHEQEN